MLNATAAFQSLIASLIIDVFANYIIAYNLEGRAAQHNRALIH
jgi:hypothetical protein